MQPSSQPGGGPVAPVARTVDDLGGFVRVAEPFLVVRELEHVLPLGLLGRLCDDAPEDRPACDFVVAEDAIGEVQAVALRTRPMNLVVSSGTPAAIGALADHAVANLQPLRGVVGPAASAAWFVDRWHEQTGRSMRMGMALRAYACSEPLPPADVHGSARRVGRDDRDVVAAFAEAFAEEALGGDEPIEGRTWADNQLSRTTVGGLWVWDVDGEVVSMANVVRPTPSTMTINVVYTPPAHRNRGYAGALTAACARWVVTDLGRTHACLFTDLSNPASNHVYTKVGFRPVGDALDMRTDDPEA